MENKENCCEEKKEGCCSKVYSSKCCMKKCHMSKIFFLVVIIIIAFCFGSFFSRMHSYRNGSYGLKNSNYMMDGDYKKDVSDAKTATGEVTVEVK